MGPLNGVRVIEVAALAPTPFSATILADLGAEVIRVDRLPSDGSDVGPARLDPLGRGRRSVALDLKTESGVAALLRLADGADVLIEGFRPGVAERLGFGPDVVHARNPRLIYGRMTGWGQEGPLAPTAGHDIDYIAIAGALDPIGRVGERPVPPLNLIGDFGGGGQLLALGVACALFERERSGQGQVIDAAMVDGAALLTTFLHGMIATGSWGGPRGTNVLDTGAPYYDTYETADGKHMAVGAIEPQFYAALLEGLGLDAADLPAQQERSGWPRLRETFAATFKQRTRDEWAAVFAKTDACTAPVLSPVEATQHEHNQIRGTFVEVDGFLQPAPAPRFSRTPPPVPGSAPRAGEHTVAVLTEGGFTAEEIAELRRSGGTA